MHTIMFMHVCDCVSVVPQVSGAEREGAWQSLCGVWRDQQSGSVPGVRVREATAAGRNGRFETNH